MATVFCRGKSISRRPVLKNTKAGPSNFVHTYIFHYRNEGYGWKTDMLMATINPYIW